MGKAHVPVSCVLDRLSEHLDMLAGQIHTTEEAVGDALSGDTSDFSNSVSKLQSLDYLRQSLEDCAMLTLILANSHAKKFYPDVDAQQLCTKLKLETTKELVLPIAGKTHALGDVQLF